MPQRSADRAPRRVDPRDEQQGHRADHVAWFELAAVKLRVDQVAREVLARAIEVLVDLREEVLPHPRNALDAFIGRQVDALEQVLDELAELRPVLRREAEHVGDDPHRDVLRVVSRRIDDVPLAECVDERMAEPPRSGLLLSDLALGERREQQLARVVVEGRIGGDRRRAPDGRQLTRRPEVAQDDRPGGEALGVVGDRRDIFVPGGEPCAAEPRGVRDRAALPQVVLDPVGVSGPLGFQMREVGRPVRDRAGDDLVTHPDRRVLGACPQVILAEPVVGGHLTPPRPARRHVRDS